MRWAAPVGRDKMGRLCVDALCLQAEAQMKGKRNDE